MGTKKQQRAKDASDGTLKTTVNTNVKVKIDTNDTGVVECEKCGNKIKKTYMCTCCGKEFTKLRGNFLPSNHQIYSANIETYGGKSTCYTSVCKTCVEKLYNKYIEMFDGSEEHAIEAVCQLFSLYYNEIPLATSKNISGNRSRMSVYASKVNLSPCTGKTYDDTVIDRIQSEKENIVILENMSEDDGRKIRQKWVKFFGDGFPTEDYTFLINEYLDWTTRHECATKTQEEIFKRICFKQLEIWKAQKENKDTKELDKTFQSLLDSAKLTPKQNGGNVISDTQTFGQLIKKWEDEKPIPEPEDEFKDIDKIGLYIDVFFRGHLAKLSNIKNGLSSLYDKYMKKYTVNKPEYDEDEDTEALFDMIFGSELEDE